MKGSGNWFRSLKYQFWMRWPIYHNVYLISFLLTVGGINLSCEWVKWNFWCDCCNVLILFHIMRLPLPAQQPPSLYSTSGSVLHERHSINRFSAQRKHDSAHSFTYFLVAAFYEAPFLLIRLSALQVSQVTSSWWHSYPIILSNGSPKMDTGSKEL